MIDGVKIYCSINDYEAWKKAVNISLYISIENETGAIKEKIRSNTKTTTYKGRFENLFITIKETTITIDDKTTVTHLLIIEGSLHKNHFGGANYLPFKWGNLQTQVKHIEQKLCLNAENCRIVNLELGVNIKTSFPVFEYLQKDLISYKGNPFNQYEPDNEGLCIGYEGNLKGQYRVKIYDKGKQYNLPENLMRFELRFKKMQKLNRLGIKYLSDLQDKNKVVPLQGLLIEAWQNILFYDSSINLKTIVKPKERELLRDGSNPKFWERLKKKDSQNFDYKRRLFKKLINRYGNNQQKILQDLIITEWQNLFKNSANLPTGKKEKFSKFTVMVKCKNAEKHFTTLPPPQQSNKRCCLSCGRDISNQNRSSRYCSAKFVGEAAAHKCRNTNSNPRNNLKNKIERIKAKGLLFDVMPYFIDNNNKKQSYAI